MTTPLFSIFRYTGTGAAQFLPVPPYLDQSHIKVYVNGVALSPLTWINASTVQVTAPLGQPVVVQRLTSPGERLVDYQGAVPLTEADLDLDSQQAFFLAQESRDILTDLTGLTSGPLDTALGAAAAANASAQAAAASAALLQGYSTGYASLAAAIAAIGATETQLVINSPVTVSTDLTIPRNVSVRVEGAGLITVAAGKRLYINGHFTAPKLKRCFDAPLLSTTITASVTGLTINVTAVSNPVLASGHVVTGGGLPVGVTIAQENAGGVGVYTLNGDWGTIASTTFTVTGASVIFGAGAVDRVYPQWFGAVADAGVTDNTIAFRHSVYSQEWGGTVSIPAGNYKVSGPTVLHGGLTIEGDGVANIANGAPTPSETAVPSHVWTGANNTAIWVLPVRADRVTLRNLSHGAAASTSATAPVGVGRKGLLFNGRAPQFVYAPLVDNCYFYNLERGIDVNDSYAASETNWGVNPGTVRNCHFVYCSYGIFFYTDNADAWKIDQCVFILGANSSGVHLVRCGFLKLDTCFCFGGSFANSEFINIAPIEAGNPIDKVTVDNCQAEFCSHFLTYDGANTRPFDIDLRSCIMQLGADIYLGNLCNFNSTSTHLMAYVYYDHPGVKINSVHDWYEFLDFNSGPTWGYVNAGAGATNALQTYIPGAWPSSTLGKTARFSGFGLHKEPTVQTVDNYVVGPADVAVVINRASTTTVVLPLGSAYPGRRLRMATRQAQLVLSSQSNIVPLTGGSPSNSILPATAGKWIDLESDGTNWLITAGN